VVIIEAEDTMDLLKGLTTKYTVDHVYKTLLVISQFNKE